MVNIEEQINYIRNLEHTYIYSNEEYNKLNKNINSLFLYFKINININKLTNTLIKFNYWTNNNLINLPLNLRYLYSHIVNCNLPPNIIYLNCYECDVNNFPRSLHFIYTNTFNKNIIPKELNDNNYNKNIKCIFKILL